jgi:colanic acid/amylovoran biosynthesis glycosyltransferase
MSSGGRHLAYVLKRFPRISETFVAAELIELERQGEHVTVFALIRPDEAFTHGFLDELRADVHYLPSRPAREPLRLARAVTGTVRSSARGLGRAAAGLGRPTATSVRTFLQAVVLYDEMRRAGIDHAHAHFATDAADHASVVRRLGGPSFSVTTHAKDIYHEQVRPDDLHRKLDDALFVATVSEDNKRYLDEILEGRARVRVVPNSVDLRRLGPPLTRRPEPGLVVSVARLVEKKGLRDLVDACGILSRRGVDVRLEIAGDGPLRDELAGAARDAEIDDPLRGALPHEAVRDLYRRAAVFCLPCVIARSGDRDGLPTSVLEAMSLGVPVVTTGINGLAETVIDGETGLVVREHDPEDLAAALQRLLGDPQFAEQLARRARAHVEQSFSLERSVRTLRTLFPQAV